MQIVLPVAEPKYLKSCCLNWCLSEIILSDASGNTDVFWGEARPYLKGTNQEARPCFLSSYVPMFSSVPLQFHHINKFCESF